MALGTFIAGVLLAESDRHELEIAIDHTGLLLDCSLSPLALNLGVLYTHIFWVVLGVVVLVAVKAGVLYGLSWFSVCAVLSAYSFPAYLARAGVRIRTFSTASPLFSGDQIPLLLVTVTLSMMTTPLLMKGVDAILARRFNVSLMTKTMKKPYVEDDQPQSIIVGFGRFRPGD